MGEKRHICKYCFGNTSNADGVCTSCKAKLVQVRKILKIGEMIKHGAEMEKALRRVLWMKGGGNDG